MWLCGTPGYPDRIAHLWGGPGFREDADQEESGPEGQPGQTVALLRNRIHKVLCHGFTTCDKKLTHARTSCAEGIPPLAESFFDGDEQEREDMVPYLPVDLQFLHKVYIILLRAMVAMGKTNLQSINCDVRVLRSLISIFDSQLLSLAPSSPSDLGK